MRVNQSLAVLFSIFLAFVACADGSGDDGEESASEANERVEVLARVADRGSDLERRILDDGAVSDAEHEESALALVACAKEKGVDVQLDQEEDGGGYKFTAPADAESNAVFNECHGTTYANVDAIYAIQNSMPPAVRERQAELVLDCLNRKGEDVDSWPDASGDVDPAIESECVDEATATIADEE